MMNDLVIIGSGGFGRELLAMLEDINREKKQWNVIGFWNSDGHGEGEEVQGLKVLSKLELFEKKLPYFAFGLGFPEAKLKTLLAMPKEANFPSLVHPSVVRSSTASIGSRGVVITAGNILTVDLRIHDFAMLNLGCTVGHDSQVGAFSVLSPGVHLSGNVLLGEGVSVGTGASIIPGKKVGAWSTIGAGAVVTTDVPPGSTAVGVPAKVVKVRDVFPEVGTTGTKR